MEQYRKTLGKVVLTCNDYWDKTKNYDILCLVEDKDTNKNYISKKEVPAGVLITNREYWQPIASMGAIDNGIIILNHTDVNGNIPYYDLISAATSINPKDRRPGLVLGYLNYDSNTDDLPQWKLYQYNDVDLANWLNISSWQALDYNKGFIGWFPNEEELYKEYGHPKYGMYAYIGEVAIASVIYRANDKNDWVNTGEKAFNYIVNFADEEDITNKNNTIKFADKTYNPEKFSGLGRVYLRKNIVDGVNVLTQDMLSKLNTIYIIQYDYDLQGAEINIPEGCTLDFQGGSLNNGSVNFNNTRIIESAGCLIVKAFGSVANTSLNTSTFGVSVNSSAEYNSTAINNILGLRTEKNLGVGAGPYFSVIFDWTGILDIKEPIHVYYGTHIKGTSSSTGLRKPNNDGDIDALIILNGGNIKVEEVRLWEGENAYGIYAKKLHRSVITNVMTSRKDIGFYFEQCWLVTINEVTASACRIGFYSVGPATTFTVNRLFIQNQKEYGIYLYNHGYSTFINCANDTAEGGTAVYASNSTCTFIGCGCESTNIVSNFHLVEYSRISIIGGHYHTCRTIPEGAVNPSVFTVSGSRVSVDGTYFGSHYESPVPFVRVIDGSTRLFSQVTFNNIACEGTWLKNVFSNQAIGADKVINYIGHGIQSASYSNYPLLKTDLGTINFDHNENGYIVEREFNLGNNTDGIFGKDYNSAPISVGRIGSVTTLEDNTIELGISPVRYNTYLEKNGFLLKIDNTWYKCVDEIVNIHSETHVLNLAANSVVPEKLKDVYRYSVVKLSKILSINDNVISLESWNASSPKFSFGNGNRLVYFSENQSGLIDITKYDARNKTITVADISNITTASELYYLTSIDNARKSNTSFKVPYLYEQNRFIAKDLAEGNKYSSGQIITDGENNYIVKGNQLFRLNVVSPFSSTTGGESTIPNEGEYGQIFKSENKVYHFIPNIGWVDYLGNPNGTRIFGHLNNRPESPSYSTFYFDNSNPEEPILWVYFGKWYKIALEQ